MSSFATIFDRGTYFDTVCRRGRALCPDGRVRSVELGALADTWFSVPARARIGGRWVRGYVTVETVEGWMWPTLDDPAIVKFKETAA